MLVDINKISGKGLLLDDSVELDENMLIEDGSFFLGDIAYNIFLKREGSQVKAKGRIITSVSLLCVYCLEQFEMKINSKFDIILFPGDLVDLNKALNPDEMEYIFYEGDKIDLSKILMEQVNLFIPFNPMCSPDCKGICPNCGINLNYHQCKCENSLNSMNFLFNNITR
ncbi:MAG: DUF177 domain-containing protein [Candidatus Aminicenantes bacterium]|nr:DUF177 domain-containing protein [Candidatus Aminicenantes bacterium]